MTITFTSSDLVSLVEAFDRHPFGALILCVLLLVVVLGIWVHRSGPPKLNSAPQSRGRSQKPIASSGRQ